MESKKRGDRWWREETACSLYSTLGYQYIASQRG
jgi:hypothetical protein